MAYRLCCSPCRLISGSCGQHLGAICTLVVAAGAAFVLTGVVPSRSIGGVWQGLLLLPFSGGLEIAI